MLPSTLIWKSCLGRQILLEWLAVPYSKPLNPIDECKNVMKASMKRLTAPFNQMMEPSPKCTKQTEYRLQYLEAAIDEAILAITNAKDICIIKTT